MTPMQEVPGSRLGGVRSMLSRGAGFGAALVLAHLEQYHRPQDNTKLFFKFVFHTIIE